MRRSPGVEEHAYVPTPHRADANPPPVAGLNTSIIIENPRLFVLAVAMASVRSNPSNCAQSVLKSATCSPVDPIDPPFPRAIELQQPMPG